MNIAKRDHPRPVVLVVFDGWGINPRSDANAIAQAAPAFYLDLYARYPHGVIRTAGEAVGLPDDQMGNSEVGHMTIGAGRIIYQELTRITKAIREGGFFTNPALNEAIDRILETKGRLHLLGLVSDGGVHSHLDHLAAVLELAKRRGGPEVWIHAFLDGRDTSPRSASGYVRALEDHARRIGVGRIATVSGRYYAMDRDQRWDRIQKAYDAIALGEGPKAASAAEAITRAYEEGLTDEFLPPVVIAREGVVRDGDAVVFANFRADRARELSRALTAAELPQMPRRAVPRLARFVCMTRYDDSLALPVAFPPQEVTRLLGEIVSERGLRQLRIAETEKYAHVTYFLNGGRETPFPGEDRVLIPSPRDVATYDQRPEMSAFEVTEEAIRRVEGGAYDLVVLNYANPDMVGHTGNLSAAVKAVGAIDRCLSRLVPCVLSAGGALLITADHGNLEQMIDYRTGEPHTAHTTNPVPCILVRNHPAGEGLCPEGTLADIAPTLLELMGIAAPSEMTGRSLILGGPPS